MMNAYCCICADLFENSVDNSIVASPCGHTFHELCLMQWNEKSSTCPTCRIHIKRNQDIKRLYFDIREDCDGNGNTAKLVNQNSSLKVQISQLTKEKKNITEERNQLANDFAKSQNERDSSLTRLKDLRSIYEFSQRELATKEKMIVSLNRELREFVETQKKLDELQNIKSLITDSEQECTELISCYSGGGEASIKQLVQMIAVVKGEYNKTLAKKKNLKQLVKTLKGENAACKEKLSQKKEVLKVLQRKAEKSDEEMFALERENNENRRKIAHLRAALKYDKTEGSQSFLAAVTEDSPNVAYSPPISADLPKSSNTVECSSSQATSPDLFENSVDESSSDAKLEHNQFGISDTPVLKMSLFPSATDKVKAAKRAKIEQEKDTASIPFSNFNILQKKLNGDPKSRWGFCQGRTFNGFGGSVKVKPDEPLGPSQKALAKFAPKKSKPQRKPLLSKDQAYNRPVSVDKLFRETVPASMKFSSDLAQTSSTCMNSSENDTRVLVQDNLTRGQRLEKSENIQKFIKRYKPTLAKSLSHSSGSVIDLTED